MKNYLYIVTGANDPIDGNCVEFQKKEDAFDLARSKAGSEIHLVGFENGNKVFDEIIFNSDKPIESDDLHNSCVDADCPEDSEFYPDEYDIEDYLDDADVAQDAPVDSLADLYPEEEDEELDEAIKNEYMGYKVGDKIHITRMEGEPQYDGKEGVIVDIDSIGQLHGTWGGCALIPEVDIFEKVEDGNQSTSDEDEVKEESYVDRHNEDDSTEHAEIYTEPSKDIPVNQCTKVDLMAHTDDELKSLEDEEKVLKDLAPEEKFDLAEDMEDDLAKFNNKVDSVFSSLDLDEDLEDEEDDFDDIESEDFVEELFSEISKRKDESK